MKKKKKTNEKYRERQTKEKEKEKLKQDGCNPKKKKKRPRKWVFLVNLVVCGTTNNIPSFPLSFHFFSFLVHLLLGNCHVHTTSLLQLYSPVATISHRTLYSSSTDCLSLSLHLIDLDTVICFFKVLSLLLFNTHCEFSVFLLN